MTDPASPADGEAEEGANARGNLPEAAARRMAEGAFTSGLTIPDFAASLHAGLEPVDFVQGFCVMQWQFFRTGAVFGLGGMQPWAAADGWSENWQCPHAYGIVSAEHRAWGQNFEETWVEKAWTTGFTAALGRMVEEATAAGAHGVLGVVDSTESLADMAVLEFRAQGTAVRVVGEPSPQRPPWTTFLAGERLAKLIEAGYAPVSVAASVASVRVYANCVTQWLTESAGTVYAASGTAEIEQTTHAHTAVRRLARQGIRRQLGHDSLHAASLTVSERELGEGDVEVQCFLRGNRVRRFKSFDPVPPPVPTVRLG